MPLNRGRLAPWRLSPRRCAATLPAMFRPNADPDNHQET